MSQFGNLPEVVIYSEFGIEHKALVIGARSLEHHDGANDEPLLNLVIASPVVDDACANCGNRRAFHGKPAPAHLRVCAQFVPPDPQPTTNLIDLVRIVADVAHESHAFTADQLEAMSKTGVNTQQAYPGGQFPGGRWREIAQPIAAVPAAEPAPVEPPNEPEPAPPVVQ